MANVPNNICCLGRVYITYVELIIFFTSLSFAWYRLNPSIPQTLLPVEGVTACVSAFFIDRGQPASENPDAYAGSTNNSSIECTNLFAAAALDLIMVLHARIPSHYGSKSNAVTGTGVSEKIEDAAVAPVPAAKGGGATAAPLTAAAKKLSATAVSPLSQAGSVGIDDLNRPDGSDKADGSRLADLDAWMVILRALSLGASSRQKEVGMHALQLLTKVRSGSAGRWSAEHVNSDYEP